PASVIVEIMNDDGTMARRPDLEKFAKHHRLEIGTIADLIQYRTVHEKTVECINERQVQTLYGDFMLRTYLDGARNERHFALIKGIIDPAKPTLVRVHVGSTARDLMGLWPAGGEEMKPWTCQAAMERIAAE